MTTTVVNFPITQATIKRRMAWLCLALCFLWAGGAVAANVLQDISYTALPGGKVEVTLKFSGPVGEPQVFITENPPRIALDIADTRNGINQRRIEIGTGATSGVSAVEAGGRTRVVVDLFHVAAYETKVDGNNLVLTVNSGMTDSATTSAMVNSDPTKAALNTASSEVSNIDFRRGKNGEGRIVVTFSGEGVGVDLKREGDKISLDMYNVKLPGNLAQRLDVLDFATPVQFIETKSNGNGAHMQITAAGAFEQLAYQSGNEYVVEVAPVREAAKDKKDKNKEPEYNGNRVTFNFQDIPTRSVLQLIADVSDLNIVVADTVQGNVTLRLINVPWDQALAIVLQAKGLDQRRKGNVIWVAPQKEIADREQALEDARIQLEQRVELVSEYIPISYGKAKDIAALLTKESLQSTSGGQAGGAGGSSAARSHGFLSDRGSVSFDERTNTLLVNDTPDKIKEIRELVVLLDRPVQQVLIESRIVIATDNFAKELGARFGVSGGYENKNGIVTTTSGSSNGTDEMNNVILNNRFAGNR